MNEKIKHSSEFVRRMFFDQSNKYRVVAFQLHDVFEGNVYWSNGEYHDSKTGEQIDIGDKKPEGGAFDISMSELVDGNISLETASFLGSIDTPFLLPEESNALLQLIQDWVFKETKDRFEDIIASEMYLERDFGQHVYRIENWEYKEYFNVFEFRRDGMIAAEREGYSGANYCASNDYIYAVAFPEVEENFYCGVCPFVPETEAENHISMGFKECVDYLLDSRSDQLKIALAEPETFIQKRNRRYWELHQNSNMSIPEIARTVAEELGMKEPDSVRNVQTGAKQHHEEHYPDIPFKERPKGRIKGR